jgi:hypothetical protein
MSHVASYKDCIVSALQPHIPSEKVQMTFQLFEALQLPYLLTIELAKFSVLMWDLEATDAQILQLLCLRNKCEKMKRQRLMDNAKIML